MDQGTDRGADDEPGSIVILGIALAGAAATLMAYWIFGS